MKLLTIILCKKLIVFISFIKQNLLNATILRSAEEGLSGVVVWGDPSDTQSLESCKQLQSYIKTALGPTVKLTIEAATNCSVRLCSGNGRCKGNMLQCKQIYHDSSYINKNFQKLPNNLVGPFPSHSNKIAKKEAYISLKKSELTLVEEGCTCLCFSGWSGSACDIPS